MIGVWEPAFVAIAFGIAIASVWVSKPIGKGPFFHDTGYDEEHPPTPEEWRKTKARYTFVLVFLGVLFTVTTWLSLRV